MAFYDDPSSLYDVIAAPDEAAAKERAQALQSVLRDRQMMAAAAQFSGIKQMAPWGQHEQANVDDTFDKLAQAPGQRVQNTLHRQQADKLGAELAADKDPRTGAVLRRTLGVLVPEFAKDPQFEDAPAEVLRQAIGAGKTIFSSRESAAARREAAAMRHLYENGGPGGAGGFTAEALDKLAEQVAVTGKLPNMGMGRAGTAARVALINRVATLYPDVDLASVQAGYGSESKTLDALQKQKGAIDSFERTAMANLDQFLSTAKGQVPDLHSPLLNAPVRWAAEHVMGDPGMTQFNVARNVAVQEVGKVLSGALGNAAISDTARKEVADLLSPNATLEQIQQAAAILRTDMMNRKTATQAQIDEVKGRINPHRAMAAHGAAPAGAPTSAPSAQPKRIKIDANGNVVSQ